MNKDHVGTCIVFNCYQFESNKYRNREGTDMDRDLIRKTFEHFEFSVVTIQNPTEQDIKKAIEKLDDVSFYPFLGKTKFFICFILTHGCGPDKILTSKEEVIEINNGIIAKLHEVNALKEKNKIIVIQSCRGDLKDEAEVVGTHIKQRKMETQIEQVNPFTSKPNFFIIFSSTPGYKSFRSPIGTTFIHMFCRMLMKHRSKLTLTELVQRLIFVISSIPVSCKSKENKHKRYFQIPTFFSTVKSPIFLTEKNVEGLKHYAITDKKADIERKLIIETLHEIAGQKMWLNNFPGVSDENLLSLVEQTTGSYNTRCNGHHMQRFCLVIDITSPGIAQNIAEKDQHVIQNSMNSLNFKIDMHTLKKSELNDLINGPLVANIFTKNIPQNTELRCLLCFVQHDEYYYDKNDKEVMQEIIYQLKCQITLLDKPKVFIVQPYYSECSYSEDGDDDINCNELSAINPVKRSKQSDVLVVTSTPSKYKTLTEMICTTLEENGDHYSFIDLLVDVLPKKWGEKWEGVNPSFSSTMRKHLVIGLNPKDNNENSNKTDHQLCKQLRNYKNELEKTLASGNYQSSDSYKMIADADTTEHKPEIQNDEGTTWSNADIGSGSYIVIIGVLLLILSLIRIVSDANGYIKYEDWKTNNSRNGSDVSDCGHSSNCITVLVFDIISLIATVSIFIGSLLLLIKCRKNCIYRRSPTTKEGILFPAIGTLLFVFTCLSCGLELVGIVKRAEYGFKDELVLSVCIAVLLSCVIIVVIVVILYSLKHRNKKSVSLSQGHTEQEEDLLQTDSR